MTSFGGIYIWTQRDYNALMAQLSALQKMVVGSQAMLKQLLKQEIKQMSALDDLTAQVTKNSDVEASAVQLIQGIAKQLADALTANDTPALQALSQQLATSADALAAAVAANTTPAPAPAPAPAT